ncbi:hypothetical protein Tco_0339100 [Tanacetum coccineum]
MCKTSASLKVRLTERQRKSSTSQPRRRKYRQVKSLNDDLNEEDASKQERSSDKTEPIKEDTAYPCLHFTRNRQGSRPSTPYPGHLIRRIYWSTIKDLALNVINERGPYSKEINSNIQSTLMSVDRTLRKPHQYAVLTAFNTTY